MGFKISELNTEKPKTVWMPVDGTDTLYVGQIVQSTSDGVAPMGAAAGVYDLTGKVIPYGIVVGTNYRKPVYNSTYKANSITGVAASGSQDDLEKVGGHGALNPVGDNQAKVEVAIITPSTVIEGPFFNGSFGTAMSTFTVSGASADGCISDTATGATTDFTPVDSMCTMYGRTGANAGAARITTDTSTTEPAVVHGFPAAAIAVGDTFVRVPARMGISYVNFDSESMYIEGSATPATNYYVINVVELRLAESGKEAAVFMFTVDNFTVNRTANT